MHHGKGWLGRRIVELHNEGKRLSEIAQILNMSAQSVFYWTKKFFGSKDRRFIESQKEEIKRLYLSGMSSKDIAKQLNMKHGGIEALITRLGIGRSLSESQILRWKNKGRKCV